MQIGGLETYKIKGYISGGTQTNKHVDKYTICVNYLLLMYRARPNDYTLNLKHVIN